MGGTVEEMQHAAYQAWLADTLAGRSSLLMADTSDQAADLASRARVDLVRAGRVAEAGRAVANCDEWVVEAASWPYPITSRSSSA